MSLNRLTTYTARYTSPDEVEGTSIWTFENYPRDLIWLESTDKKQAWTDHSKVWYNLNVSPYYGKTRVLRRKIVKWISIVSLREGVMPHMFAVWSVAFYRCFQCNCYARRGDLSLKGHPWPPQSFGTRVSGWFSIFWNVCNMKIPTIHMFLLL